jgi:exopolyphosphatase/guanosine-5'-triphosphate,3'-diphosphate pyrophosphatase
MRLLRLGRRRATTDAIPTIPAVRVGVVDVGANTVRLLVASREGAVREERVQIGLGEEVERTGRLSRKKILAAAETAAAHARRARKLGCVSTEILVTSPGRQSANAGELIEALHEASEAPVRVLSAEEEAVLAWHGAVAAGEDIRDPVAVCDVGGGSLQLAVGTIADGPAWARSIDLGSLRLTRRVFEHDPPTGIELERARAEAAKRLADLAPPLPRAALATGGTARALRRVVGRTLGPSELEEAIGCLAERSSRSIVVDYGVDKDRARTLTAGAILVATVQRRIGVPFAVARGGLREGAALALIANAESAARSASA